MEILTTIIKNNKLYQLGPLTKKDISSLKKEIDNKQDIISESNKLDSKLIKDVSNFATKSFVEEKINNEWVGSRESFNSLKEINKNITYFIVK